MEETKKQRVIIFPYMAQGHITPFINLANIITKLHPNYSFTLVNTPANIKNIKSSLPDDSNISLKSLPFDPSSHNLPPNGENCSVLPFCLFVDLFVASETLQPAFEKLLLDITEEDGEVPFCIVADYFMAWSVESAHKLGIFHSVFVTTSAYGNATFLSIGLHSPQSKTTEDEFTLPNFPEIRLHKTQLTPFLVNADGNDRFSLFYKRQIAFSKLSDAILVSTVRELEPLGLKMQQQLFEVPIYAVGPLVELSHFRSVDYVQEWLDKKSESSVLYISFGSQNTINAAQMMELALALEETDIEFVWVIRPPFGFDIKGVFRKEWLPHNFEERIGKSGKGILVHQWASQVDILSHPSIGAFLSHCGWNSVVESLMNGVPIIGWPLAAEQFYNTKFLEEMGVCIEVTRGNTENSKVEKQKIVKSIKIVLSDGKKKMKKKAGEIGEVLKGAMKAENGNVGSCVTELNDFLQLVCSK